MSRVLLEVAGLCVAGDPGGHHVASRGFRSVSGVVTGSPCPPGPSSLPARPLPPAVCGATSVPPSASCRPREVPDWKLLITERTWLASRPGRGDAEERLRREAQRTAGARRGGGCLPSRRRRGGRRRGRPRLRLLGRRRPPR